MISKSQAKFIKSLQLKKYRLQEQCFVVDGEKGVEEVINSDFEILQLVVTQSYFDRAKREVDRYNAELLIATESQLMQIGSFQTNRSALAVVRQKPNQLPQLDSDDFILVLDDIRDPGNLGSIIRTADWFGMRKIMASEQTADFYNPKVINATMGSFTRVQFGYGKLEEELKKVEASIYGTFMEGADVHSTRFEKSGFIVVGNEANGISPPIQKLITNRITIPGAAGAESLNVAIATGIVLDNWSRLKK